MRFELRLLADYEHAAGRAAAADVKHRGGLRAFDLIIARRAGYLLMQIQHLAHAGASDRMSCADEAAARIDRQLAAHLDDAFLDRLPRFARLGYAEVIDCHVLGSREAIVRLDGVDLLDTGNTRALERIDNRLTRVRQDVLVLAALGHFHIELEWRRMMTPSEDAWNVGELLAVTLRPFGGEFLGREENRRRAVGDLRAVAHLNASADDLVELRFGLRVTLAHEPVAGLRERISLGIRVVGCGNLREILVLQPVTFVVLVAEASEQLRERKLDALGFLLVPRRGAEEVAAGRRIDGLHLFHADHAREVVAARFDLRRRGENRDRAGGACGFMAAGRESVECGIDLEEKRADMSLMRIQFGGEVADVRGLDFLRINLCGVERAEHGFAHRAYKMFTFLGPVAGEVSLRSTQNVHGSRFRHRSLLLILSI